MKIITTPRMALDGGYWAELCDMKNWNVWTACKGIANENDEIELSIEEARKLRII